MTSTHIRDVVHRQFSVDKTTRTLAYRCVDISETLHSLKCVFIHNSHNHCNLHRCSRLKMLEMNFDMHTLLNGGWCAARDGRVDLMLLPVVSARGLFGIFLAFKKSLETFRVVRALTPWPQLLRVPDACLFATQSMSVRPCCMPNLWISNIAPK